MVNLKELPLIHVAEKNLNVFQIRPQELLNNLGDGHESKTPINQIILMKCTFSSPVSVTFVSNT